LSDVTLEVGEGDGEGETVGDGEGSGSTTGGEAIGAGVLCGAAGAATAFCVRLPKVK